MTSVKLTELTLVHLGCEKNRVDSEHMLGLLVKAGYKIGNNVGAAGIVIINTCSFIAAAREEAMQLLLSLQEQKKRMIICGCLAQQFQEELLHELPTAAGLVGTADYQNIVEVVKQIEQGKQVTKITAVPNYIADENLPRIRTSLSSIAWLKIAEGCDCRCAFCIIPKLRGDHHSRTIESILAEVKAYEKDNVKELILISQNTTNYGLDLYKKQMLPELLNRLQTTTIPWIRVHYTYPTGITTELLEAMRANSKVVPYFDIPLQHSHPEILKSMNRPFSEKYTVGIIKKIRKYFPHAVLRTTFIVGFPGEKQEHFAHLLNFVQEMEFDHVGVFCYSAEEGTKAFELPGRVRANVMESRREKIMLAQQHISLTKHEALIGSQVEVLVEQDLSNTEHPKGFKLQGRSPRFSPEIDGFIYLKGKAEPGQLVQAKIIAADYYDLFAEIEK